MRHRSSRQATTSYRAWQKPACAARPKAPAAASRTTWGNLFALPSPSSFWSCRCRLAGLDEQVEGMVIVEPEPAFLVAQAQSPLEQPAKVAVGIE